MVDYTSDNLLYRPVQRQRDPGLITEVTPGSAGWNYISFQARRLHAGDFWPFATNDSELAIVNLSGMFAVDSNRGKWERFGGRLNVFDGIGHVLYLPRHTDGSVTAQVDGEFAVAWVPSEEDHAPLLVQPEHVKTCIRGGDNATRQINLLLPPGSPVHRLVILEVYTPSGSWSSYPPHKHDVHRVDQGGAVIEADLEEIYYFRFDRPSGYALQQVYTDSTSPLHQDGRPIDAVLKVMDHDVVIVPEGYHPVCGPPGYRTYYLNVLAGSAQSLANTEDP